MPPYFQTTTDRVLVINWSGLGNATQRKQAFGGHINGKGFEKIDDGVYFVPRNINLDVLDEILRDVILPSDRAILTYPHGKTSSGSSAMRIRIYGKSP